MGDIASIEHRIALSLAEPRFYSLLLGGFAGLGLLLAAVSLLLLLVALLASYLPARRAARTDPIATLRAE